MVQMQHPKLPAHQTIDVPELGVAHRERSGWQRVKPYDNAAPKGRKTVKNEQPGSVVAAEGTDTEGES